MAILQRMSLDTIDALFPTGVRPRKLRPGYIAEGFCNMVQLILSSPEGIITTQTLPSVGGNTREMFLGNADEALREHGLYLVGATYRPERCGGLWPHMVRGIFYKDLTSADL